MKPVQLANKNLNYVYYCPQTKLRGDNVFIGVCPVGGRWVSDPVSFLEVGCFRGGGWVGLWVCLGGCWVCPGSFVLILLPDAWDLGSCGYGRQAGGTHPTGMLSC